jgi:hypothetical protein
MDIEDTKRIPLGELRSSIHQIIVSEKISK